MIGKSLLIFCSFSLMILNSCKKHSEKDLSDIQLDFISSAKDLYESKVKEGLNGSFKGDWNNYIFEGDSLLVVKMIGHSSIGHQTDNLGMVSGVIFTSKNKKIARVQKVEFIGNKNDISSMGLKIIASYNKAKAGKPIRADGNFMQYSVKHNSYVTGFSVNEGKIELDKSMAKRRLTNPNLKLESKTNVANSTGKLMSGGTHNQACDPVYLVVWDRNTGKILSWTWLYDDCAEEDGAEPPTEPVDHTNENNQESLCDNTGEGLDYSITGENNLIEPEIDTETATTRNYIYQWVFLRNGFGMWACKSTERGFHKKVGDEWQWDKIEHLNEGMEGITPGTDITISNFVLQPTVGKYYATGKAYFNFKAKIICDSKFNPVPGVSANLTATCEVWYVNDIF